MKRLIGSILFVIGIVVIGFGQQTTKNTADQTLRSEGRVNPSTLGMEFDLPLGSYPGRGFNLPLGLSYSSKVWRFEDRSSDPGGNGNPVRNWVFGGYSEDAAAGWTSSLAQPYIEFGGTNDFFDNQGRKALNGNQVYYMKRINVVLPGGESHELRADDAPIPIPTGGPNWEGTFYASDGSGIKYVQNSNSNLGPILYRLYLSDGSFYDFDPQSTPHGWDNAAIINAIRLTDASGNYVAFNQPTTAYPNGSWTDQLGRVFPIMIPATTPTFATNGSQEVLTQAFAPPGINPQTPYVLTWKRLGNSFADNAPAYELSYIGAQDLTTATTPPYSPALFPNSDVHSNCGPDNWVYVMAEDYNQDFNDPNLVLFRKFNPMVLTEIVLPNGAKYEFKYNPFGEIETIHYPAGGHEKFDYDFVASLAGLPTGYQVSNRGVSVSRVYESDSDSQPITSQFSSAVSDATYRTSVIAPDGTQTDNFMYRGVKPLCDTQVGEYQYGGLQWGYDSPLAGRTYETRIFSNDSTPHLTQRTLTNWVTTPTTVQIRTGPVMLQENARVSSTKTTTYDGDNGVSAVATLEYDQPDNTGSPLNVTARKEFDYSAVTGGSTFPVAAPTQTPPNSTPTAFPTPTGLPVRSTETTYQNAANYTTDRNLLRLPTAIFVKEGTTLRGRTQMYYDESTYVPHTALSGTIPGWTDPGATVVRGLLTTTKNWYDVSSNLNYVQTHVEYNILGSPVKTWDAKGNVSQIVYSDNFSDQQNRYTYAYPTQTISAVPGGNGSSTAFTTTITYDFDSGLPVASTDINNQTTSMEYSDPLRRPTKVTAPNGQQTITEYGQPTSGQYPSNERYAKVSSQIDDNNWKVVYTWYDGLNRTIKTQKVDTGGDVFVMTCYDPAGRVGGTTNPSRTDTSQPCTENPTSFEWITNTYDSAGRLWKVTTADAAVMETTYGVATGNTTGTVVTVTDQAGKLRRSITDGLGRLIRVDEPDLGSATGSLADVANPYQPTNYTYDVLNNLLTVTQASNTTQQCGGSASCSQTRTFTYDSLSRLKSANNPESGTTTYSYDQNGNLASKKDARNITTTYTYDALNRVTQRSYATPTATPTPGTYQNSPTVTYYYDNVTNAKGKLMKVTSSVSTTEYTSFDILGRVTASTQTTDGVTYGNGSTDCTMTYTYNLAGALIEQQYPSCRVVKSVLDANGDLSIVESKKNASTAFWQYADHFSYDAAGAVTSMRFGSGAWEKTAFNNRLQPSQIALGKTQGATDLLKLDYSYGTTSNNGNLLSQSITVPNVTVGSTTYNGFSAVQNYSYDSLNRLKDATETISTTQSWKQTFTYDRYGNRRFDEANTTMPASFTNPAMTDPVISPNNNKITSAGWTYDAAGNTLTEASGQSYVYDSENKQVTALNGGGTLGEYYYDGDGKRVKKVVSGTGEITIFLYDATGKQVAEYSTVVAPVETAKLNYLTSDHLGSPRINTDRDANVTSRHDYHPFGEEVVTPQRTSDPEYAQDGVRKEFSGFERDGETDLDYAQTRYHASTLGRFMSSDAYIIMFEMKKGKNASEQEERLKEYIAEPRNLNRYVYALDNPLKYTDPIGMRPPNYWEKLALAKLDDLEAAARKAGDNDLANALTSAKAEISQIIAAMGKRENSVAVGIAVYAILQVGTEDGKRFADNYHFTANGQVYDGNKCNVLVAAAVIQGGHGKNYPTVDGKFPVANFLGDIKDRQRLGGIPIVYDQARVGDIVAWRATGGKEPGHSGISIGGGAIVYAGGPPDGTPQVRTIDYVNQRMNTAGGIFTGPSHEPGVIRRYNGKP
jgi:RHS repeat-associated protein